MRVLAFSTTAQGMDSTGLFVCSLEGALTQFSTITVSSRDRLLLLLLPVPPALSLNNGCRVCTGT